MWINRVLNQNENIEEVHIGKVTACDGTNVNTLSHVQAINVPLVFPSGMVSLPLIGDELVLIPVIGGEYVACGQPIDKVGVDGVESGEVKLYSAGGGYIHLKRNGDILLNGVRITKDGQIIGKGEG